MTFDLCKKWSKFSSILLLSGHIYVYQTRLARSKGQQYFRIKITPPIIFVESTQIEIARSAAYFINAITKSGPRCKVFPTKWNNATGKRRSHRLMFRGPSLMHFACSYGSVSLPLTRESSAGLSSKTDPMRVEVNPPFLQLECVLSAEALSPIMEFVSVGILLML